MLGLGFSSVVAANTAPVIFDTPNQLSKPGESIYFALYAYDPDNDPVSYVVSGLPDGLVFDETYPAIEGTPSIEGDFQISIQIDDGSLTAEESFWWTISADENAQPVPEEGPNVAPIIMGTADQTNRIGDVINLAFYGYDENAQDVLSYSISGLPEGVQFNEETSTMEGIASTRGNFTVNIEINDGSLSASESFVWTITGAETEVVDPLTNDSESDPILGAASSTAITSSDISNFATGFNFSWDALEKFPEDPSESNGPENPLDWKQASFANDANYIYLNHANHDASFLEVTAGQMIYLDTDNNASTGWQSGLAIGADHIIQGRYIYSYAGDENGTAWQWGLPTAMDLATGQNGNLGIEYRFPKSLIGDTDSFNVVFVGSNELYSDSGELDDLYPDGAYDVNSSTRFFTYRMASGGNSAPVVNTQKVSTQENQKLEITLDAIDPDGDQLIFTHDQALHGEVVDLPITLAFNEEPNNEVSVVNYTPFSGFTGTDTFSYEITDSITGPQKGTVIITVFPAESQQPSNYVSNLVVDGNLEDWVAVTSFANDPADNQAWADDQVDLVQVAMAHSDTSLYVNYENATKPLEEMDDRAFNIYLDTDSSRETGFSNMMVIGSDYLVQGQSLYQYAGDGNSWSWTYLGDVERAVDATGAEVRVDRAAIGNPESVNFVLVGDNIAIGGLNNDLYPNGLYSDPNSVSNDVYLEAKFFSYALDQSTYIEQNTLTLNDAESKQAVSGQLSITQPQQPSVSGSSESKASSNSDSGAVSIFGLFLCLLVSSSIRLTQRKKR